MNKKQFNAYYKPSTPSCKNDFGIFVWRADGMYRKEYAVKIYKNEKTADKVADKMNIDNAIYVVREVLI